MRTIILTIALYALVLPCFAQALYTTTLHGGTNGGGTICKLENGKLTAAYHFDTPDGSEPCGKLVQATDGKLYGMTSEGGKYNVGTIFSYYPATGEYTRLIDFDTTNGAYPNGSLLQATDGKLYGVTGSGGRSYQRGGGVLFSFEIAKGKYTKCYDFADNDDLSHPIGSLVQAANGKLYGTTLYSDIIFSYNPSTGTFVKEVDLTDSTGSYPVGSLLLAKDGKLYGMTRLGGGSGQYGVLFSFNPLTNVYTKLKGFTHETGENPQGNLILAKDGRLYGTLNRGGEYDGGTIFSYEPATAVFTKLKDLDPHTVGHLRTALFEAINGELYGTGFMDDSTTRKDVVFSFNPVNKNFKVMPANNSDITLPEHLMLASNGKVYGTSGADGSGRIGALYQLDLATLKSTKLRDFGVSEKGYAPRGPLTADSAGVLYGITRYGGRLGKGVIFSFNPATGVYKKIRDWDDNKNYYEVSWLTYGGNGMLYGVNPWGGSSNDGTLFSVNATTGVYTNVWQFKDSTTGYQPQEQLVRASDGKLYGMTNSGGSNWKGVLFSYDPSTSLITKLFDLSDSIGSNSYGDNGNLIQATDGKLYGMTYEGGKYRSGVLFTYDIGKAVYSKLIDFNHETGERPYYGGLIQANDGMLYGVTDRGGESDHGVLFSYNIGTGVYTKRKEFPVTEEELQRLDAITKKESPVTDEELKELFYFGRKPVGRVTEGADGKLYGIWEKDRKELEMPRGETYENGGVYSFDPVTGVYTQLQPFTSTTGYHPKDTYFIAAPVLKGKVILAEAQQ